MLPHIGTKHHLEAIFGSQVIDRTKVVTQQFWDKAFYK